jgi:hypothetical protein
VRVGLTATFTIAVSGTAPITLQWRKGATVVATTMVGAAGTQLVSQSSSHTTPATVAGDDGAQYSVVASNGFGSVTSSSARLTVVSQRLFVTDGASLLLWNNPHTLSTARPADLALALPGARAVATFGSQVFVLGNAGIANWADGLSVTALSAPSFTIPLTALTPAPTQPLTRLTTATMGDGLSLLAWSQEGAWRLSLPGPVSANPTTRAAFKHPFNQLPSLVYVPLASSGGDRLFMGQISGAGLLAWNGAGLATGQPMHDFATTNANVWALALSNSRLVGGGSFGAGTPSTGIGLWNTPGTFSAPRAADVMLASTAGTFSTNDFIADLSCDGAVLAAGVQNLSNQRLLVWGNVDTATAASAPSFSGVLPASPKRVFSLAGRHYTLTQTDVVLFATPIAGMTLTTIATLNGFGFTDFAVAR